MLTEQTLEKLGSMKLSGMASALRGHLEKGGRSELSPTELVGMLVDAEFLARENKRVATRLRMARFRDQVSVEEIDWKHPRGVTRPAIMELVTGNWLRAHHNLLITGATGLGKTFLACALGNKFCRDGRSVMFRRTSRLFDELKQARGDGSYRNALKRIARTELLILDDFGLESLDAEGRQDLLEILEDRYNLASTLITSQLPTDKWHALIKDDTRADSILDRLVHNAARLNLSGESIRKTRGRAPLTEGVPTAK